MNWIAQLQLDVPVIQAPMAGVSTPELAAAVSDAGGLGSISIGAMTVLEAAQAIDATRMLTERPFNVNVFCHAHQPLSAVVEAAWLKSLSPLFQQFGATPPERLQEIYLSFKGHTEMLNLLLEKRPAVVSFHFGLPPKYYMEALQQAGIRLIASATNLQEGQCIEQAGLDAIVAQGIEAGGHRGVFDEKATDEGLGTLVLTRLLVQSLKLPVIAAGGLMDGAGIRAALSLGASAVQMGTAFIACPESSANAHYRAVLQSPQLEQTLLTTAISGRPARGLPNALTRFVAQGELAEIPAYPYAYDAAKALQTLARASGSSAFDVQWAGQGAPLSRALPVAELMEQLKSEWENAIGSKP
jgi:nitronate monooxygenase